MSLTKGGEGKRLQFGKKSIVTGLQRQIVFLEQPAGLFRSRHIERPPAQPLEAVVDPLPGAVIIQPVLAAHINEHPGKTLGKNVPFLLPPQLLIGSLGKGGQAAGRESQRVVGQEMIINDIGQGAGIKAVIGAEKGLGLPGNGVSVRKIIDSAVQGNPLLDVFRVVEFFLSLDKVADHIARQDSRIAERKVCMR